MAQKFWGEMPTHKPTDKQKLFIPDVTSDIERAMDKSFLSKFDEEEEKPQKIESLRLSSADPLILYTISLHKYANKRIEAIQQLESNKKSASFPEDDPMELPKLPNIVVQNKSNILNYVPKKFTNFTLGCDIEVPDVSRCVVRQVLFKNIATLFAHIGFQTSQQNALEVMTDALEDFLKKITYNYKTALDEEVKMKSSGFPCAIERVLTELGMGGVKGINDYYQCRVIKYVNVTHRRCRDLKEQYEKMLIPNSPSPIDKINKVVRVKVEEEDVVEVENPEVHFSTIDGDVSFSILETGYQLLNSLEAEADMQVWVKKKK